MTSSPPSPIASQLAIALGGKYEVRGLVGQGGFAEVYEVWDKELERRLAVKVLRPDVAWTSGMVERFQRETRATAKLQHPNILPIHFVGEGDGLVYYAMPYVEGMTLGDLIRRSGALPADRALAIAVPVLDALQHAHDAGLLHRDIKPDNIMLDSARGRPLLMDFGIARRLDAAAAAGLTQTGLVIGTPHYMSPEQALGDPKLDQRSDLYSMGAVLFQMVTGSPPFDGESSQQVVGKHIAEPPPFASDVNPRVPRRISDVIARCLEKQPGDRFQTAAQVIAALEADRPASGTRSRALDAQSAATEMLVRPAPPSRSGPSGAPGPPGPPGPPAPPRRRRRLVFLSLAIGLPLLTAGAGAVWFTAPRLSFANRLAATVAVRIGGEERRLDPGASFDMRLTRGRALELTWRLVRPRDNGRVPLGVSIADTVRMAHPRGRVFVAATARRPSGAYFTPLVTNQTGAPLSITVNAGLAGAMPCNCTVPPGAVRQSIGYYPLFVNSTVRARDARGRSAEFRDLGTQVEPIRGIVGLVFRAEDFSR